MTALSSHPPPTGTRPVTVVIPTVGRPELLRQCLESLARCEPRAQEVVVVDQSGTDDVVHVVDEFADYGARRLADPGRGRGRAVNCGLRVATHATVLVTDDDCTVRADWVGRGSCLVLERPDCIFTGRVLALGNPKFVPSTKVHDQPVDYTNTRARAVLYAGNMACSRDALLAIGGFDERIVPSAEDNDLCHRWLHAGRALRYEPSLTTWHHDWRTPEQLREHYRGYARGEGMFYAKHLRQGDLSLLFCLLGQLGAGLWSRTSARWRSEAWADPRLGILPGILQGLREGWRVFGAESPRRLLR